MELIEKVNFHYEYQLANIQLSQGQRVKINKEYEYLALLWGGVKALANYQEYDLDYLKLCEKFNPEIPILKNNEEEFDRYFWGELSHKSSLINSKITSSQLGESLGLNQNESILRSTDELREFLRKRTSGPSIIRTDFSVSGRGVFIYRPEDDLDPLLKKVEKERQKQALVVSPYLDRVQDFSVIMSKDNENIIYETVVDNNGKFCGVFIDRDKMHSLRMWMSDRDAEVYKRIFDKYRLLGADKIQVDSFYYYRGKEKKIFHLVEVNARKTMGEMAYRIFVRNYPCAPHFYFYLRSQAQKRSGVIWPGEYLISPKTSRHSLFISVNGPLTDL